MKEKNLGELKNIGFQTYEDRHGRTLVVNRKEKLAYVITKKTVKAGQTLKIKEAPGGGFAVSLKAL